MTETLPIKIRLGPTGHGATVEIDGKDMSSHIQGLQVIGAIGDATRVHLTFVNVEVDIEGVVESAALGTDWATYRLGRIIRDEIQEGVKA